MGLLSEDNSNRKSTSSPKPTRPFKGWSLDQLLDARKDLKKRLLNTSDVDRELSLRKPDPDRFST